MLLLQGSGLLPFTLLAGASSLPPPCSHTSMTLLALGAALSALGNVTLLRSGLLLFGSWWEVWGTQRSVETGKSHVQLSGL